MKILKVSARSVPNAVAGAIAAIIREKDSIEIQTVGAGAANQALKAIAISRGYLAPLGIDIVCAPAFMNVVLNEKSITGIKIVVEPRDDKI